MLVTWEIPGHRDMPCPSPLPSPPWYGPYHRHACNNRDVPNATPLKHTPYLFPTFWHQVHAYKFISWDPPSKRLKAIVSEPIEKNSNVRQNRTKKPHLLREIIILRAHLKAPWFCEYLSEFHQDICKPTYILSTSYKVSWHPQLYSLVYHLLKSGPHMHWKPLLPQILFCLTPSFLRLLLPLLYFEFQRGL